MSALGIFKRSGKRVWAALSGASSERIVINEDTIGTDASVTGGLELYSSDGAGTIRYRSIEQAGASLVVKYGTGATGAAAKAAANTVLTLAAGITYTGALEATGAVSIDTANGTRQLFLSPDGGGSTPPTVAVLGDLFIGADGVLWRCTVAGNPATWEALLTGRKLSKTLLDNTAATAIDATWLAWADTLHGVIIDYVLWRGATPDSETGSIHLAFGGANPPQILQGRVFTAVDPGVTFTVTLAANVITLKYATTATGQNATAKFTVREVW